MCVIRRSVFFEMKRFFYNAAAVVLLLAMLGTSVFGAVAAGMLRSNGGVSVNGSPATSVTTVFAGDRIETAPKAVGNITVTGSSLLLEENSSMVFNGQDMDFYCGGGTIQTTQSMSARYGRLAVKPVKDTARYQVLQSGPTLKISAMDGDLILSDGTKDLNVPAGRSMNVPYTGCVQQLPKSDVQDGVNTSAATVNPQPSPIPSTTPMGTGASVVAPSTVASVALTGIIAVSKNPVSPQAP